MLRTNIATTGVSFLGSALLGSGLLASGCLITTNSVDDEDISSSDTEDDTDSSNSLPTTNTASDSNSNTTDSVGETTGTPEGECSDNLIGDGGFEAGTPSPAWTEMSINFETPICDTDCTQDPGADPYEGDWYAWFGGIDTDPEVASVSQLVTIDGDTAFLSFRFQINAAALSGNDFFEVTVDGTTVWLATDAEIADYETYTPISVDISDFADGNAHTVMFLGDVLGEGELTNFFLDNVSLVTCTDGVADTSGSTSASETDTGSSSDTTAADSSGSDSGTDTSGTTDGSTDGGSGTDSTAGSESGSTGV